MAVGALFFILGAGVGNWVVRIPDVQHRLGLSPAALGTALLAASVGALIGMPVAGHFSIRRDAATVTIVTAGVFTVSIALPAAAPSYGWLIGALVLLGIGNGALGVTANAQGALLERRMNTPIMATFHAVYSIGGLLGSLIAGVAAGSHVSAAMHLDALSVVMTVVAGLSARYLLHDSSPVPGHRPRIVADRRVALLSVLAFCTLLCEGSVSDWSAVLMHQNRGAPPGLAGMGYTAFALAMVGARLRGDRTQSRFGARTTLTLAGLITTAGSIIIVAVPIPWTSVLGFAILGIGLGVVFPSLVSFTSRYASHPAAAVATISTTGYFGCLAGPPLIGYLAQSTSLPTALLILTGAAIVIVIGSRVLPDTPQATAPAHRRER